MTTAADSGWGQSARTMRLLPVALVAVLAAGCYVNTLSMGFVNWDDYKLVVNNPFIRSLDAANIDRIWTSAILETYLPMRVTSYAADYFLWGLNPAGFHLTNIILHAVCAVLVYFIVARLSGSGIAAFFAGALFAAHPVHTEAVAWVSGRKDVLSTALFLLAYLLYLVSVDDARRRWWVVFLSLAAFFLSGLAKAMVITLPFLIVLTDFVYGKAASEYRWFKLLPQWTAYFVAAVLLGGLAVNFAASAGAIRPYHFGGKFQTALFMCWAALYYVKTMLLPNFLSARYPFGDTTDFGIDPAIVYLSPFVLFACIVAALWLLAKAADPKSSPSPQMRLGALGLAWFFVTLLPVMNIVSINVLVADRYLYLPSAGFIMACAAVLWRLWDAQRTRAASRLMVALAFVAVLGAYCFRTVTRNEVWRDSLSLWTSVVHEFPRSAEARLQLASAYADLDEPDFDRALAELDMARDIDPESSAVHLARGKVYVRMGRAAEAAEEFAGASALGFKGTADAYDALLSEAAAFEAMNRPPDAVASLEKAISVAPRRPEAYNNLGRLKERFLNDIAGAKASYKAALKADPKFARAWYNLGILAVKAKDFRAAAGYYKEAVDADPFFAEVRVNLATLYLDSGDAGTALGLLKEAVDLKADLVPAHLGLARTYAMLGDVPAARQELDKALELEPGNTVIQDLKARLDDISKGGR